MQHIIHEIFNTLVNHLYLIDWTNVIPLISSALSLGAGMLKLIASKPAAEKVYLIPIPVQSRRMPPKLQTRVRRRKHRTSI